MEELFRVVLACVMLAPMARSDIQSRTVYRDVMTVMVLIAACHVVHDAISGELHVPWLVLSAAMTAAMLLMWRMRLVGFGDVAAAAILAMTVHEIGGLPVAAGAILGGYGIGAAYLAVYNAWFNISDIVHGRPHSRWIVDAHVKRWGERFCRRAGLSGGIGRATDGGDVLDSSGGSLFVPVQSAGMRVSGTVPAVAAMLAALVVASVAAYLS